MSVKMLLKKSIFGDEEVQSLCFPSPKKWDSWDQSQSRLAPVQYPSRTDNLGTPNHKTLKLAYIYIMMVVRRVGKSL